MNSGRRALISIDFGVVLLVLGFVSAVPGAAFHVPPAEGSAKAGPTNEAALKSALHVKQIGSNTFRIGRVEFDRAQRTVAIPARVRLRTQVVEYALVTEQGKAYESVFTTDATPADIHVAFLLLGMGAVPLRGDYGKPVPVPETNAVTIDVAWNTNGQPVRVALPDLVCLTAGHPDPTAPAMRVGQWLYNGSGFDEGGFAAQREGSIISLIRDPLALINNPGADRDNDDIHFPNVRLLPAEGTAVKLILRCGGPKPPRPRSGG